MSEFANPSSSAAGAQAAAYTAGILRILGDRDPLVVLRETPAALASLLESTPWKLLSIPEAPGKWSITEVVQHLADSDLVGAFRFRMIIAHDRPRLVAYDQDLWAKKLRYSESDIDEALADFTCIRKLIVRMFELASPADLARIGIHPERGEESLGHLMKLYAGHDLVHLQQIERIRGTVMAQAKGADQ